MVTILIQMVANIEETFLMEHFMELVYFGGHVFLIQPRGIIIKEPGFTEKCKVKDNSFTVMVLYTKEPSQTISTWLRKKVKNTFCHH